MIESETEAQVWLQALPSVDDLAFERLIRLVDLLQAENREQNLVSAKSLDQVWVRHIADSAQLDGLVPRETNSWMDLGTGAGFPGLVMAILRPTCAFTLVEARPRRCDWLKRAIADLGLVNARIVGCKIERVESAAFEVISARAVAPLDRLIALAARFSTKQTVWVLPKGQSGEQELRALTGWHHAFHVKQSLTDAEASVIVGTLNEQDRHE